MRETLTSPFQSKVINTHPASSDSTRGGSFSIAPKFSVVIPTYNREEKLNRLLQSIIDSGIKREYEVIVVDDSDEPVRIDQSITLLLGGRFHLVRNPRRRFISIAKNLGWKEARGEYVFFIDDDNILPERTADLLCQKLDSDKKLGAIMPVVYYEKRRNLVWVYSAPFAKGRWRFDLIGRNTIEKERPKQELIPTDALPNASMIRREILERIGGIDESLPINSSCDMCQRIKKQGHATCALTTAAIFHDVTPPGTPGYWAEHASEDYARRYYEVRDWFDLMSRLHSGESLLVLKEVVRSLSFLVPVSAGVLLHPSRRKQSLRLIYGSMLRGLRDGIRVAALSGK